MTIIMAELLREHVLITKQYDWKKDDYHRFVSVTTRD